MIIILIIWFPCDKQPMPACSMPCQPNTMLVANNLVSKNLVRSQILNRNVSAVHAGALGAYSGTIAKSGALHACVNTGSQLSDGSRVNSYRTGEALLCDLQAKMISSKPVARNLAGTNSGPLLSNIADLHLCSRPWGCL